MLLERIAQLVLRIGLRTNHPVLRRIVSRVRTALVRAGDPSVEFDLTAHQRVRLPLSHELPYYRRRFPLYAQNVVDIAAVVSAKYPGATCIDIGANVGDSAVLLQQAGELPVLCIEGDAVFLRYLRWNVRDLPHVEIAPVFVARPGSTGEVVAERGTAHLALEPGGGALPTATLEEVLAAHPRFRDPHLVKIDTDGMDVQILSDNAGWLSAVSPVVLFEYDPHLGQLDPTAAKRLWRTLQDAGYREAVFYENTGELHSVISLDDRRLLEDLHNRYLRTKNAYADVCLLSRDDADLVASLQVRGQVG